MTSSQDIPALVSSRICHDLISPIGAVGNGMELLAMTPGLQSPELDLIAQSIDHANARIRFFRIAFGAVGAEQRIAPREILSILKDMAHGARIEVDWQIEEDLPRREVKLAFLMLLGLETALPRGGRLLLTRSAGKWRIVAQATRLRFDRPVWEALAEGLPLEGLTPAEVQFALIPEALASQGRRFELDLEAERAELRF